MTGIPHFVPQAWQYVFNTPLECGLRCAALLLATYPSAADLQRLVQYEYLLVHSGDIPDGPPSLHPPAPHRAGELLVRRALVERGVLFMMSQHVICREFSDRGMYYIAGESALPFLDTLQSQYSLNIRHRAEWVIEQFGTMDDESLYDLMRNNWDTWGSEFARESFVRGGSP